MKELYSIKDKKTVSLITSNNVVTDLDPSFRETIKISQLSSNTRLESLLELIIFLIIVYCSWLWYIILDYLPFLFMLCRILIDFYRSWILLIICFDYFFDYGVPLKLLLDQNPSCESELFQQLMKILAIKKIRSRCYRSSTKRLT